MTQRVRRTQAERSASTRAALTEAAIKALYEHGYAATTTMLVAKEADVSRGAMLHQFGTKHELMIHVVESVYEEELTEYRRLLAGIADPAERLLAMCDAVWSVLSRPSGVAVLEILQGSRSDRALAERLAPVQARIEENALTITSRSTGLDRPTALALMRLIVWSARGLSIASVLAPDPGNMADAVGLLRTLLKNAITSGAIALRGRDEREADQAVR